MSVGSAFVVLNDHWLPHFGHAHVTKYFLVTRLAEDFPSLESVHLTSLPRYSALIARPLVPHLQRHFALLQSTLKTI